MTHRMKYFTANTTRQRRLRRCTNINNPEDLKSELGAMRLLALEAMEQGNLALADRVLTGIGKLAKTQVDVQRLRGEFITRGAAMRIIENAVNVLADCVQDKFPGWQDALDRAADEIMATVENKSNDE